MDTFALSLVKAVPSLAVSLLGVFFIFISLKTLIGRRPVVFSPRWLFALFCMVCLPMIAGSIDHLITFFDPMLFILYFWVLLFAIVLLVFSWTQMRGYMVCAVSDTYFREALLSATGSLGFSIE